MAESLKKQSKQVTVAVQCPLRVCCVFDSAAIKAKNPGSALWNLDAENLTQSGGRGGGARRG